MKKLSKFFVTLLIVTLTMSCYTSVFADNLSVSAKKLIVNSTIVGQYPEVKDMDSLNKDIVSYINKINMDLAKVTDLSARHMGKQVVSYTSEDDGDYTILKVSLTPIRGIILSNDKKYEGKTFYINAVDKKVTSEADYKTYVEEREAAEAEADGEEAAE